MVSDRAIKKKVFELTLAVYRVTDRFPREEALRHQLREAANEILEDFVFYVSLRDRNVVGKRDELLKIIARTKAITSLLKIARSQQFVNELNFDILEWEYGRIIEMSEEGLEGVYNRSREPHHTVGYSIEEGVRKIATGARPKESIGDVIGALSTRQRELLGVLKNNGKTARLKEIVQHFPGLSEKTIRNDLKFLCEKNLILLNGRAPQSYYTIK